jgi:hypothetical protein
MAFLCHSCCVINHHPVYVAMFLRVVKLSSRNLNFLIVAGATLLYVSVFLYIFSERDFEDIAHDALCNVRHCGECMISYLPSSLDSDFDFLFWIHPMLCRDPGEDMESLPHILQYQTKEKG